MVGEQEEKFQNITTYQLIPVNRNIRGTFPMTKQFTRQPAHSSCLAHCSLDYPLIKHKG